MREQIEKIARVVVENPRVAALRARAVKKAVGLSAIITAMDFAGDAVSRGMRLLATDGEFVKCPMCEHFVPVETFSTKTEGCTRCRQYKHLGDTTAAIRRERDDARAQLRAAREIAAQRESEAHEKATLAEAAFLDEKSAREKLQGEADSLGGLLLLIAENCVRLGLPEHVGAANDPLSDPLTVGTAVLTELRKLSPVADEISPVPPPTGERSDGGAGVNAPAPASPPASAAETSAPPSSGVPTWEVTGVPFEPMRSGWREINSRSRMVHYFVADKDETLCGLKNKRKDSTKLAGNASNEKRCRHCVSIDNDSRRAHD